MWSISCLSKFFFLMKKIYTQIIYYLFEIFSSLLFYYIFINTIFKEIYISCYLYISDNKYRSVHFSFRWSIWKLTSFFPYTRRFCISRCDNKMRSSWKLLRARFRRIFSRWYISLLIIRLFERDSECLLFLTLNDIIQREVHRKL